jgi:hypothetical protein
MTGSPREGPRAPGVHYEISVEGGLDERWSAWFDGLSVTSDEPGRSTISGVVDDQSALHGLLGKIRDLGLTLISVRRIGWQP